MRNRIFNGIVVIILGCIFLSFFIFSHGFADLEEKFESLNPYWILIAILCIITFWLLEIIILYIITKTLYTTRHLFIKSIKFGMIGQLFSALTPFQSGMQPAQLYAMTENGIPAGYSGSILMVKFIIHQATLTIYSIIVLLTTFSFFNSKVKYFLYFCIFGFVVNTLIIIVAILFSVNDKLTRNILKFSLKLLSKIKIVKDTDAAFEKFDTELISFHESAAYISKHVWMCIFSGLLTFLQWTVYYAIPYCIYRSFDFNSYILWTMISAQVFLTLFLSFLPLPGAAVGAEGGFYIIYGIFFKSSTNTLVPALFFWRIITYYFTLGAGGLITVLLPNKKLE
jgi:uncharacterized protein (TIRG00374 family)